MTKSGNTSGIKNIMPEGFTEYWLCAALIKS
jgi:hypothetical protein